MGSAALVWWMGTYTFGFSTALYSIGSRIPLTANPRPTNEPNSRSVSGSAAMRAFTFAETCCSHRAPRSR